jgi:HD-GYP domain-containing protein (c-di-GMP phosphodiesterase class II)
LQSRMMTIADIYDALTASDRPYKRAVPTERALDILRMEVADGLLDQQLVDTFIEARVFERAGVMRS